MKSKIISLVFMLAFAFSSFAIADDGETGQGTRAQDPPPATAPANETSSNSSTDLLTQIINAITSVIP